MSQGALAAADRFARRIHSSLAARNLSHIVDTIFVSDHGMVDTSDLRLIYVDDILGEEGWNGIEHNDGTPIV
jgi:predicted AlkP superfamily pyrophosphatase or phosphodiesterase